MEMSVKRYPGSYLHLYHIQYLKCHNVSTNQMPQSINETIDASFFTVNMTDAYTYHQANAVLSSVMQNMLLRSHMVMISIAVHQRNYIKDKYRLRSRKQYTTIIKRDRK